MAFMQLKSAELPPRLRVLVYVASLGDEENAFELYRFVPQEGESPLVEATKELLSIPKKERRQVILAELKKLTNAEKMHSMGDIEPGWFLESLKREKPQTIGLILRHLPGEKARYVLDHLPKEVRSRLPKMSDTFKISESLIDIIRDRFERQFPKIAPPRPGEELSLKHLYFIKVDKLLFLFKDLGIDQLARAFKGVHKTALKAFLNRLLIKDAKEFQARIKSIEKMTTRELREAQTLLLDLPIETIEPESLFLEVGMAFFAKALAGEEPEFVRSLQFKLPTKLGYLLKRYVDASRSSKPASVEWARKQVLEKFHSTPTE